MKDKPREIRWAIYCLLILVVMNVIALAVLFSQNASIAQSLADGLQKTIPSLSVDTVRNIVSDILVNRNMFHLLVIICWSVLTYFIYKGRNWGRWVLVAFTLLSFVGTLYAFSTTQFLSLQVLAFLGWVGRLALLWLLLVPKASREYFRTSRLIDGLTV
jgi:hypothetical protein